MSTFGEAAVALAATAAVAAVLVGLVTWLAPGLGWLDIPVARSAHRRPVPRMGGVGIACALGCAALVLPFGWTATQWAALGLVAVVGFLDDLWNLPATPRLLTHVVAAALLTSGQLEEASWIWRVASVLWLVGFINAFNFMDGIDGIAGLHAAVAGVAWLVMGLVAGEPRLALMGAAMAGACAGFLLFNWHPARTFMGDVGATFLGATLAAMPWGTPEPARWMLPAVVVLAPFWVDAGVTLLGRIWRREILHQGHQQHFYQRLTGAGLSHATVASGYGAMTVIGGAAAVALTVLDARLTPAMTGGILVSAAGLMGLCAGVMRQAVRKQAVSARRVVLQPLADD